MGHYKITVVVSMLLIIVGLYGVFKKANEKGWKAFIPVYNLYIWLKIIKKSMRWFIFLAIPFINVFMIMLMSVEILKCFKKNTVLDEILGALFPFIYIPYLAFSKKEKYTAPDKIPKIKKTVAREWIDAILFAVVAASIIRTFMIEAYTIPTSSMEKSLLVGDFLFVSKINYGPRVPNTPIAFPFVHHTLPLTKYTKSYLEWLELPYYRFWGFEKIKNNDVVVFNYPDGDTVALKKQNVSYYALIRELGKNIVWNDKRDFGNIVARPVDKRENYIKRCIGIAGDTLKIIDRQVYINGKPAHNFENMQCNYDVITNGMSLNPKIIEKLNITDGGPTMEYGHFIYSLTKKTADKLRKFKNVKLVKSKLKPKGLYYNQIFPYDSANFKWNEDNFGHVYIPKAGVTIPVSIKNISLYKRIIDVYENNDLEIKQGKIYINGKQADKYTFKMNYYWMMGDNRHNSADSRFWGFVPEDHIVGKALFVWLSLDKEKLFPDKLRWHKMFRTVK